MEFVSKLKNNKDLLIKICKDKQFDNASNKVVTKSKKVLLSLLKFIIIVGIAYIILGPIISIVSKSFFSSSDIYNPLVYLFPQNGTLGNYKLSLTRLNYFSTIKETLIYVVTLMGIQVLICSMVGYGFARFEFPLKKVLFACVILTIVIPTHTIMLPLYMEFQKFDVFGIIGLITGTGKEGINLLGTRIPIYIMTILGCGLRSGLYIYIFNQFFRGLPKEIEEAAFIDGAGTWYTYFRIMLVNAIPSVITVAVFSLVWQYNDMFYARLFTIKSKYLISLKIATLQSTISNLDKIYDPQAAQLYLYAGIVLTIIPVLIIYIVLQKYFMEGVERSGIVG